MQTNEVSIVGKSQEVQQIKAPLELPLKNNLTDAKKDAQATIKHHNLENNRVAQKLKDRAKSVSQYKQRQMSDMVA